MEDDTEWTEPLIRWHAIVYYQTDQGPLEVEHDFEELEELHDLVEHSPHWDTIIKIEVFRVDPIHPGLTVEQAKNFSRDQIRF
jgi:hypothetical protein